MLLVTHLPTILYISRKRNEENDEGIEQKKRRHVSVEDEEEDEECETLTMRKLQTHCVVFPLSGRPGVAAGSWGILRMMTWQRVCCQRRRTSCWHRRCSLAGVQSLCCLSVEESQSQAACRQQHIRSRGRPFCGGSWDRQARVCGEYICQRHCHETTTQSEVRR